MIEIAFKNTSLVCCKNMAIIGRESDNLASLWMQITIAPCLINQKHVTLITWQSTQEELNLAFVQSLPYQMVHG